MSDHSHLRLHLFRLKPGEAWNAPREGLLFLFPKAGAGEYLGNSCAPPVVQALTGGDVLVFQAESRGKVRAATEAEFAFCAFSVCFDDLFPIFTADEIPLVQPLLASFKNARFYSVASFASAGWHQLVREVPAQFDLAHRSQLLRVAGDLLAEEFRKLRPPFSRYERAGARVNRLFEQLSVEQILDLSVAELADRFRCSSRHLNRLFHQHFGMSVGTLRMEMRLLKVAALLRDPEFRIAHVAERCGFNHLGLFNACFKRRFGASPGQWRKNLETDRRPDLARLMGAPTCRLHTVGLCPWLETPGAPQVEGVSQEAGVRNQESVVSQL